MGGTSAIFGFSRPGLSSITTGGTSRYWPLGGNGFGSASTTEALGQMYFYSNGTLKNLGITITTNTYTLTFTSRINGGAGAQSISQTGTGHFSDSSNMDSVTSGQNVYIKAVTSDGSHTVTIAGGEVEFKASTGSGNPFCFSSSSYTVPVEYQSGAGSLSAFAPLYGGAQNTTPSPTETKLADTKLRVSGTLQRYQTYVLVNTRTVACSVTSRKSTTDQNQSVSIPNTGATGYFEDSSNTDTVSGGDIWKYHLNVTTGTGTLGLAWMGCWFTTTNHQFDVGCGWDKTVASISTSVDNFYPISGYGDSTTTEANVKQVAMFDFTAGNLRCTVPTNSSGTTVTAALSINGSAGTMALSITNAVIGDFEDSSNQDSITATETLAFRHGPPNNSSWIISNITMTGDPGAAPHRKRRIYWSQGG